jgi:hypothetical protein
MKRLLTAALAAAAMLLLDPKIMVRAQSDTIPPAPKSVNLTMEQRHTIKEIIKDMKVENASGNAPSNIGDVVPEGVKLQPVPVEVSAKVPQVKSHSFFVKDGRVVLVDPKDNKVSDVVE